MGEGWMICRFPVRIIRCTYSMVSIGGILLTLLVGIFWWIVITLGVILGFKIIIWFAGGSSIDRAWIGGFASTVAVGYAIYRMIRFNRR